MSYNGIGLKSAKGSSTSGHVQKSLAGRAEGRSNAKNYTARRAALKSASKSDPGKLAAVKHESMAKHLNKRKVELQVSELRDKLEDQQETDASLTDEVIDERCNALREELSQERETEEQVAKVYKARHKRLDEDGSHPHTEPKADL
ncbi:U2-type spliceosomal complex subunit CWC21 KNAG_0A03970 [Huiozyma naganishii CBS 8797]|uniref:Pre-mRNA-splicing factor CWC21 n=1 Tax=Huiozyma naganishii (strain ATCC MYA-139 / BCRC 22969 / CBS 8797 / KCTC 17520 / NBRC 10181 / NCYC 3082 / Yp74L-3) TaxID=1071383 RepID=J7S3N2_HUIN7|nr:hypothetical protein KNAG_0A03970 [Kazachstania naganishii CBS 8797]CCK68076.1 hypothetical protein KNAG_0A03970 [Kazachstania naganishii CBS 8797]